MQNKQPWLSLVVASLPALAAAGASAAGFGPGGPGAVLGQPLDFVIQLRTDAGEALAPECVAAEVTAGEHRVPPALVRTVLELLGPELARVRVQTLQGINEPVIGVQLTVGCQTRIARRFLVLADPPSSAATPAAAAVPVVQTVAAALAEVSAVAPPVGLPVGLPVEARVEPISAVGPPGSAERGAVRNIQRTTQSNTQRNAQRTTQRTTQRSAAQRAAARTSRVARSPAHPPAPRLKLEAGEPLFSVESQAVEQAIEAVVQAANAARAAASAASAAQQRIATLERSVEQLRGESRVSRDLASQLRERLAQAERANRWMLPLLLALTGLAWLSAWLAWRLSGARRARPPHGPVADAPAHTGHRQADASRRPPERGAETWGDPAYALPDAPLPAPSPPRPPGPPAPFVASAIMTPAIVSAPPLRPRSTPAWPAPAPAEPAEPAPPRVRARHAASAAAPALAGERAMERTRPLPAGALADDSAPRDVSIEELIDLEQQAEFFVVLGQDGAAIELLAEHLRNTGGGSPLPYLKLLEIYQRGGDRQAYERTRTRFNQRFNAYAPQWGGGLQQGRALEDYAGVVPRLQQVWPRPLDAMAELEALLFRKSRGDLFDLPAYREVLFLYSMARDLLDREAADTGNVDLLLPLADGGEFGTAPAHPHRGPQHLAGSRRADGDDRPTGPIDLDLSSPDKPSSIFDPFDERAHGGRR